MSLKLEHFKGNFPPSSYSSLKGTFLAIGKKEVLTRFPRAHKGIGLFLKGFQELEMRLRNRKKAFKTTETRE